MTITHLNPDSLHSNPAFSQAAVVEGAGKTIYVGGQNGVDRDGAVVGNDLASQGRQALQNVLSVLEAAGAGPSDVVKLNVYIATGHDVRQAFMAAVSVWGMHPTALTVLQVAGFANPEFLVEVDAVAVVAK